MEPRCRSLAKAYRYCRGSDSECLRENLWMRFWKKTAIYSAPRGSSRSIL
jgi:hypothetical protein